MTFTAPNAYLRTRVLTASPAELRLMLFDGAIKFTQQAISGLHERDYEKAYIGFTRAQDIVMELISGLRPEHDPILCEKLSALYTFIYSRLVAASTQRDSEMGEQVIALLQYERDTWSMVLERLASENVRAKQVKETPTAPHASPHAAKAPSELIGGKVSLKG